MRLKNMPSQRKKDRYILFRVMFDENIQYENLKNALMEIVLDFIGENDMARSGFRLIKNLWDSKKQQGVIVCTSKYVDQIKTSFALLHQIGESRIIINTVRVSGTIKSLKKSSTHD